MKRIGNLFEKIISEENLSMAIDEVNNSHNWKPHHRPNGCTAWVQETKRERIAELREIIVNGFEQKPPKVTRRWDANAQKWRTVSEPAQWPDQYVHHALVQVLQPLFMRGMDFYCCGSIKKRGPHHGRKAIERWMKKDRKGTKYELTSDIRHFYDSLQPETVMERMRQLIKDRRVLDLIWRIVKDGVMIGAYTSQWFANTVLQPLDRMIRQSGFAKYYVRYMDNLTVFGPNKRKLRKLRELVEKWLNAHNLQLKGDWQIFPTKSRMPDAMGYRYGRGYTIPRKRKLLRLKRAVARYRKRRNRGGRVLVGAALSLISRLGQLKHCNNVNLYRMIFQGERLVRELKNIIRQNSRKEILTWNMYLARRAEWRSSKSKGIPIPI